ncbi:hypothetical protein [Nocardia sp. CA-290969]|uniref:hypothetical protein n=1 Tax=Nocardia sp. CA-290969 TaxID=3239986 RepID=UPI003D936B1D
MRKVELIDGSVIYHVTADDFNDEQRAALRRHGYRDDIPPCGVGGGPDRTYGGIGNPLRARVCQLDGVEIDGHESSDLDIDPTCIHCGANDPDAEDTTETEAP